ncbi:hypothetical protein LWI29_029002 [Acer saccharum]|uniref:HAT C-terminal dimerisation domain-containing protein n=1 Tax=Acer saccharum TaxID=4024 RepID=A0AA39S0G7_ACESA|nr:hypothetical protein LWI29_029002 [Acer saccharum]
MEQRFDDRVDIGSYYHTYGSLEEMGGSCPSSSGEVSSKGVRGPIDRFFQSKGNDNEHGKGHNVPLPLKDAKEASKLVTMDVGRFFFENGIPFNVAVSTSFASMCRSIGDYGQGYKVPSPHDLSTWVLKKEEKHFWPSVVYAIKTTLPLIKVLRLVVGDEPAMGFLYDAIDEAKDKISKNLKGELSAYKEIWDIIDKRWEFQLHRHLHAAAYFMNPQFQYSDNFSTHSEIRSGLYQVMDKLIVDLEERELANTQLDAFVDKRGIFGYPIAQSTIKKRSPTDWWNAFGHETPELKKFAVNVLSLTCVASVHTKKRNRLTTLKMHKLVYIMYNKRLKDRHLRRQKLKENEDPLLLDRVPSDDEWLVDEEDEFRNDGDDDLDLDLFDGGDVTSRDESHGTSSKKRKGHPTKDRNVTSRDGSHGTSSKKRKGHPTKDKGLLLIDEEDEWVDPNPDESSLDLSSDL